MDLYQIIASIFLISLIIIFSRDRKHERRITAADVIQQTPGILKQIVTLSFLKGRGWPYRISFLVYVTGLILLMRMVAGAGSLAELAFGVLFTLIGIYMMLANSQQSSSV